MVKVGHFDVCDDRGWADIDGVEAYNGVFFESVGLLAGEKFGVVFRVVDQPCVFLHPFPETE